MKGHACWSYSNNFYFNLNSLNHWVTASHSFYSWLGRRQTHPTSVQTGTHSSEQGSVNDIVKSTSVNYLTSILGTILINHVQKKRQKQDAFDSKKMQKKVFWSDKDNEESGMIRVMKSLSFIKEEKRINHLLQ